MRPLHAAAVSIRVFDMVPDAKSVACWIVGIRADPVEGLARYAPGQSAEAAKGPGQARQSATH
jgi:hypothetical protein